MDCVTDQVVTDHYALYCGDCVECMQEMPSAVVHLSLYSPPFAMLYTYSSSPRDLSNCLGYDEFMEHYSFVVRELHRVTMPGRMSAVHCADVPTGNSDCDALTDFPGDVIRLHRELGWSYVARYHVWKEPLGVRNRTMAKGLMHQTVVEDASRCSVAGADYLLIFRRSGDNPVPVEHPTGMMEYAGARELPHELLRYRGWTGDQKQNRYSHWIWRQYASAFWDDVRLERVLPYQKARDEEDEKHVHPLQLDVIERAVVLWSNPGETVLTPFAGVGSELYGSVINSRRALGFELKPTYYRQAVRNLREAVKHMKERPEAPARRLFSAEEAIAD